MLKKSKDGLTLRVAIQDHHLFFFRDNQIQDQGLKNLSEISLARMQQLKKLQLFIGYN